MSTALVFAMGAFVGAALALVAVVIALTRAIAAIDCQLAESERESL